MVKQFDKFVISVASDLCYFHVFGDKIKYLDFEALYMAHPELQSYLDIHYYEINSVFFNCKYVLS